MASLSFAAAPPHVKVTWPATALGSSWAGYRVYRRVGTAKPGPWVRVGAITNAGGMSAANAEAYRVEFRDYTIPWTAANSYQYTVTVVRNDGAESTIGGTVAYSKVVLADGPAGYWRLGESSGTSAADSSGNGRTGTYVGSPTLGTAGLLSGDTDTAATLNGTSQAAYVAHNSAFDAASVTVECWAKFGTVSGTPRLAHKATGNKGWILALASSKLSLLVGNGATYNTVPGATTLVAGTTYHLVAVTTATAQTLYVNGTQDGTGSQTYTPNSSSVQLSVGYDGSGNWADGVLDEVAVYGAALNGTQVAAHYTAGTQRVACGLYGTTPNAWWLTNNEHPELSIPLDIVDYPVAAAVASRVQRWEAAGRDRYITASRLERPGRVVTLTGRCYWPGDDVPGDLDWWQWARTALHDPQRRPQSWCLLSPQGSQVHGTPSLDDVAFVGATRSDAKFTVTETSDTPATDVDWQGPSRLRFDGTSGVAQFGDIAACDFAGPESFTVLMYTAIRATHGSSDGLCGKGGNVGAGWYLRLVSGNLKLGIYDGTTTSQAITTGQAYHDGTCRVYAGRRSAAADTLTVWVDGTQQGTGSDTTTGSLASATGVYIADIDGNGWYGDLDFVACAVYAKALTDAEMAAAAYALRGYPGFALPPEPVVYVDMRDRDSYGGTGTNVYDLSGNGNDATLAGSTVWVPKAAG